MKEYVSLNEAASYLGVSKATLRNWDRGGKLRAVRHPINNYRVYSLDDLKKIHDQLPLFVEPANRSQERSLDVRGARKLISRLHNILRDQDSNSNIIERFDELTKLLFLKIWTDQDEWLSGGIAQENEADDVYVARIRELYEQIARNQSHLVPANFAKMRCSNAALIESLRALSMISFEDVSFDVKGLAYEEVIKHTFDKGDHQQFFTPPQVVKFMVDFLSEEIRGEVCDPAAGTGGFLVEIAKVGLSYNSLTAFEIDERLAWVSGINLFTHGARNVRSIHLSNGGTLGHNANEYFQRFDTIITNPPFGSDFTDISALNLYELGKGKTNRRRGILFLERCFHLLKDGGSLGIILDEGILNLPSASDVRQFILSHFDLLGVVSLPETAFMPYASVNASILFLRKQTGHQTSRYTLYAKPENVGRKPNGDEDLIYTQSGAAQVNSDFPMILDYRHAIVRGESVTASDLVYKADIRNNLASDDNGVRLDFRYHHPSRNKSRQLLESCHFPLVTISDICSERNVAIIPSTELPDSMILYTGLAHIESETGIARQVPTPSNSLRSAVKRYESGDIIFARMRPNLRKVALMSFADGGFVSPECSVLSVRNGRDGAPVVDPLLLSVLLRSEFVYGQIMHLIAGIGRPRIGSGDLRRVRIPIPPRESQATWKSAFLGELASAGKVRGNAHALLRQAAELERSSIESVARAFVSGE